MSRPPGGDARGSEVEFVREDIAVAEPGGDGVAMAHSGRALAGLREILSAGVDRPDGRLPPQSALARRLGVTRQALRRALEVLEAEGAIWRNRAETAFISIPDRRDPSLDAVGGLLEARLRLEPELAALAALRAGPEDLRLMRHCAGRETAAGDVDARELWGGALHRRIAVAAGNPGLMAAYDALDAARAGEAWRAAVKAADWRRFTSFDGPCDHDAVIEAIASGDPERAAVTMRAHLLVVAARAEAAGAGAETR